jgi:membrane-associated protein
MRSTLVEAVVNPLNATSWLSSLGALGVFVVLFAETGLLVGFFLPGDSLLFTAGLFCTTAANAPVHLSLPAVLAAAVGGALVGAQVGFALGRRGGRPMLARAHNGRLQAGVGRADELFARYGYPKAIVLARFIPVVRTVLNPLAGMLAVPTRTFTVWQVTGGAVWSIGLTLGRLRTRRHRARSRPVPTAGHRPHRRHLPDPARTGTAARSPRVARQDQGVR